jgi:dTDP-4-dehydrorhamnose 3,5-epimerase-like enzyme
MTPVPAHRLIEIPCKSDPRGMLHFAQEPQHIPFTVRRIFYLHHLAPGTSRGGHAHRRQHQFLVLLAGSARIEVDDGRSRRAVVLDDPGLALYCPPMLWLDLGDFSSDALCLVLTSDVYDETDYIRDLAEFRRLAAV